MDRRSSKFLQFFISFILLLFLMEVGRAQGIDTLMLRRGYQHVRFDAFASDLEKEFGIRIFYEKDWLKDVYVDIPQSGFFISGALSKILARYSLTYEIFDGMNLVILPVNHNLQNELNTGSQNGIISIGNPAEKGRYKTVEIDGQVLEGETGMPIPGAVVYNEETREGITTGKDGRYKIKVSTGEHTIRFSFIGLEERKLQVVVYEAGTLNVELYEKSYALEEVIVKEIRKDRNIAGTEMGSIRMDAKTVQKLPVLMGETDIIKSLVLLPGVLTTGEGTGGFNVRGGNSDQNLILMDDAPVYNPSHLFGMFSIINPDAIKGVNLMKGDIPAQYGGRTSSVMEIVMKNGNNKLVHAAGGIGPLNSKLMIDGPFASKKGSFLVGGRSTYSDWILKQLPDINLRKSRASFYDVNGKINYMMGENDHISVFGYLSNDWFRFGNSTQYGYRNIAGDFNWNHYFSRKLYSSIAVSYSRYQFSISDDPTPTSAYQMVSSINDYGLKAGFKYLLNDQHRLEAGLDATYYTFNPGDYGANGSESLIKSVHIYRQNALVGGIYLSDDWTFNERISLSAGIRYSQYFSFGPANVYQYEAGKTKSDISLNDTVHYGRWKIIKAYRGLEPRLGIKISTNDKSSIKLSYNRHFQYIHLISNSAAVAPTDLWQPSGTYLRPQIADQLAFGYYHNFSENIIETSVEVYYKKLHNLVEYKNGASLFMNPRLETELINSEGKAYGLEVLIRKTAGRLTGWGGYTYSRSLIRTEGKFPEEIIRNGDYYPAYYDKPHDFTLAMNYQMTRRWRVSGNFTYNTGRPVTLPGLTYYYNGTELVYFSERNNYRMPDYHRLDLSVSIDGNLKKYKRWKSSWTLSIYNVYGRKNVFSVFYQKDKPSAANDYRTYALYQLSIIGRPFPSLSYNFTF